MAYTRKGSARVGRPKGSRLGFDNTVHSRRAARHTMAKKKLATARKAVKTARSLVKKHKK